MTVRDDFRAVKYLEDETLDADAEEVEGLLLALEVGDGERERRGVVGTVDIEQLGHKTAEINDGKHRLVACQTEGLYAIAFEQRLCGSGIGEVDALGPALGAEISRADIKHGGVDLAAGHDGSLERAVIRAARDIGYDVAGLKAVGEYLGSGCKHGQIGVGDVNLHILDFGDSVVKSESECLGRSGFDIYIYIVAVTRLGGEGVDLCGGLLAVGLGESHADHYAAGLDIETACLVGSPHIVGARGSGDCNGVVSHIIGEAFGECHIDHGIGQAHGQIDRCGRLVFHSELLRAVIPGAVPAFRVGRAISGLECVLAGVDTLLRAKLRHCVDLWGDGSRGMGKREGQIVRGDFQ